VTHLTGFDEALAAVIARRRAGAPCPHEGRVWPPLPSDEADAAALARKALAAPSSARRRAVLALLGVREPSPAVVQMTLWPAERRAA
jgi:hypothetical protein